MRRSQLPLIILVLLAIPFLGCGLKNVMPSKDVPPLDEYSTIVLVSADAQKQSDKYADLPTLLAYGVGTRLEVRTEGMNWIYDKSQEIAPVSDKLKELNITAEGVYQKPEVAKKLADAFGADIVIVWQLVEEPRFTKEESGKITEDKSKVSVRGAARYYTIHQSAILKADAKILTKTSEMIWDGRIIGYQKYATQYDTGSPPRSQREETMLADVRKDFVEQFTEKIYPAKTVEG